MIKGLLPILYTSAGVSAAAVTGYVVVERDTIFGPEKEAVVQTVPAPEETEVAKLVPEVEPQEPEPVAQPEVAVTEPVVPVFSLLRVEKDGSVVVAGSGPGDSDVTLFNGEVELGKTRSGSEGDFVFVLDEPLAPGSHELTLQAQPQEGEVVFSKEAGLINIPEPETQEEATVLVAEAGEATRVLQKPEVAEPETALAKPEPEPEKVAESEINEEPVEEVVQPEPDEKIEITKVEEPVAEPVPSPVTPVLIEAADIENGKIFIAGTGEAGSAVNLYLDGQFVGTALVGSNGAFLYEGDIDIEAGRYDIRADSVKKSTGEVLARAEVLLVHEPVESVQKVDAEPELSLQETASEPEAQDDAVETAEQAVEESEKKEIRTGSAVIIRRGDNLWRIARRNYGDGIRYTTIFDANRDQIRDPNLIYPGQVFKVPEDETAGETVSDG